MNPANNTKKLYLQAMQNFTVGLERCLTTYPNAGKDVTIIVYGDETK